MRRTLRSGTAVGTQTRSVEPKTDTRVKIIATTSKHAAVRGGNLYSNQIKNALFDS